MAARQRVVVDAAARQREQRGRGGCPTADVPRLGTALRRMATAGDHPAAAALLESCGANMVNDAAEDGSTALHNAARAGATEVAALLLGRGADLGAMNVQQRRPLQIAVMARQLRTAQLLLERLADVAAQDVVGGSALHNAVAGANTELTALLLNHGAPASATDLNGGTALHVAASCWHSQSSRSAGAACVPSIRLLLSWRASVTAVDHYGRTPLHDASESASLEATRLLLHAGADASAASRTGLSPAKLAVEQVVQHYGGYLAQAGERKLLSIRKLLRQLQGKLERGGGAEDGPALTEAQAHNGLAWVLGAPHLPFDFRAYLESNGVGDAVMVAQLLLGQSRATPEAQTVRWMLRSLPSSVRQDGVGQCRRVTVANISHEAVMQWVVPTIITRTLEHWDDGRLERWSREGLLAAYGKETLGAQALKLKGSGASLAALFGSSPTDGVSLGQILGLPSEVQPSNLFGTPPHESALASLLPSAARGLPNASSDDSLPPALRRIAASFPILGTETALSLGVHRQWNDVHRHATAVFTQVAGRKGWALWPPLWPRSALAQARLTQESVDGTSRDTLCGLFGPTSLRSPADAPSSALLRHKGVLLCELEPGEMLFIPSLGHRHGGGWWHGTCNLDAWSAGFTTFHTPALAVLSQAGLR